MEVVLGFIVGAAVMFVIFLWAGSSTLEEDYRKRGIRR